MSYARDRFAHDQIATFTGVLDEFRSLFERHTPFLMAAIALIATFYSLWDLALGESSQLVPQLIITILVQYYVIERLLADRLPEGRGSRRFRSVFGSGVLSAIAILFGLLLFIFPGLLLLARWSIATPLIVEENVGSVRALGDSWDRTGPSNGPLLLIYLAAGAVYAVGLIVAIGISAAAGWEGGWIETVTLNLTAGVLSVFGWILATAIYRCVNPHTAGLDEVFA